MPAYRVFGRTLVSELGFPQLDEIEASEPAWLLRVDRDGPAADEAECREGDLLGEDEAEPGVNVRFFRGTTGYSLVFDDTGVFRLSDDGGEIRWTPPPGAPKASARLDVLGRVLPAALHASGRVVLHGSAVAIGGRAVAFLAPKRHGKSTLAAALLRNGARLVADDVVAVEAGSPPRVLPGIPELKLREDAARAVGLEPSGRETASGKGTFRELAGRQMVDRPLELAAVYLLAPRRDGLAVPAAHRVALSDVRSALVLVRHAKLGPLLGGTEARVALERAAGLARSLPVFRLELVRDLERVDEAVKQLSRWHAAPPLPSEPA